MLSVTYPTPDMTLAVEIDHRKTHKDQKKLALKS
jgi:hypothetical protein